MPTPPLRDEDDLDELPPLDGDGREEPDAEPLDADDELLDERTPVDLDDSTGEDDPADASDLDLEGDGEGWLDEPAETPDLDLGDVSLVDFAPDAAADEAEEPGVADEDFGLGGAPEHTELDSGDEGPVGSDEELREGDLPRLDADDEGDVEDATLVEEGFAADEPVGLPWAAEPWPRVGAPVALAAATAVACVGRGALVAGRPEVGAAELVRVDLEGTSQALSAAGLDAADVRALAAEGERVVALLVDGRVRVSRDGGATFEAALEGVAAAEVAVGAGVTWLRTRAGGLLVWRGGAEPVARLAVPGLVAAMARDVAAGAVALVADEAGPVSALVRVSPDGVVAREAVDAPDAPDARRATILAARGEHVAYAASRGVVVRHGGAGRWEAHAWDGRITALAFLDDAGTLVAAAHSDADDTTALVRLDTKGHAAVVARIGPARTDGEGDGVALALAHDDARGVVWVAGASGVAAFAVR